MKILVTNDDGIRSPVLSLLADALHREHEVRVAAPATDQSGMSHSFTHGIDKRLAFRADAASPYPKYEVMGTPCDCIKFAVAYLFKADDVDLVISGINLGENAGMSAVYSGTVAAAREGAMWGIPGLAVSVWKNEPARLKHAVDWILELLRHPALLPKRSSGPASGPLRTAGDPPGTAGDPRSPSGPAGGQPPLSGPAGLWNINFPPCEPAEIAGQAVTAMSTVMFRDSYEAIRSEHGLTDFRLVGYKPEAEFRAGTDDWALARKLISITPLRISQSDEGEALRAAGLKAEWDALAHVPG
jgi:5'-nucleotidase